MLFSIDNDSRWTSSATRVKLGTKTGPTFQYSLFKGFYITKTYHINIYYTSFKLFIHFGYIDIKIDN